MNAKERTPRYLLKALTDLWTGDANRKGMRLITTGLLGSVRWWFEVLVRGLGGTACDPSDSGNRCPQDSHKRPTDPKHHCVVCELFGCTGWARKFRFQVLNEQGDVKQDQIKKGDTVLFVFTALRPIRKEEWALLDLTLRLIADYGAIGGRTVFKPSDESGLADLGLEDFEEQNGQVVVRRDGKWLPLRAGDVLLAVGGENVGSKQDLQRIIQGKEHGEPVEVKFRTNNQERTEELWYGKRHHQDLGLIEITESPQLAQITKEQLCEYLSNPHWRHVDHDGFAWASLENFWCVKGHYLARQDANKSTFNRVICRAKPKAQVSQNDLWLAGRRPDREKKNEAESKKVFSFKYPGQARRTFGFVQPGRIDFNEMKRRLECGWPGLKDSEFLKGEDILSALLTSTGGGTP